MYNFKRKDGMLLLEFHVHALSDYQTKYSTRVDYILIICRNHVELTKKVLLYFTYEEYATIGCVTSFYQIVGLAEMKRTSQNW